MKTDQSQQTGPPSRLPRRIETQIHRRKKARAFSPLLPEWDQPDVAPPAHLRMESSRMGPPQAWELVQKITPKPLKKDPGKQDGKKV